MKVIIIGAGAAGLMAAYWSAAAGSETLLLEKNEKAGKKIYITGKGRCNVTNACDFDVFQRSINRGQRFMMSALRAFGPEEMMRFLEQNGCRVKTERGNRVFPVSDHASDVTKALLKAAEGSGARLQLHTEVIGLEKHEDVFSVSCITSGRKTVYTADKVIVCTGGLSYPSTGSTGDGYRFAEKFGHTVSKRYPSLVSLETGEDVAALAGVSLKNVALSLMEKGKKKPLYREQGELLFTHRGISGPLVLSASSYVTDRMDQAEFEASLDLKPALSEKELDQRLLREFEEKKNTDIGNALENLLISGIRQEVLERAGVDRHQKVRDITRQQRQAILQNIRQLTFVITGTGGFEEAVITRGGVSLKELDPKTMESKRVPGLFFAGEVLDIDAMTGGFNLQLAFSSACAAGRSLS